MSPSDIDYPVSISPETTFYSVKSLANSIVNQHPFVVSTDGSRQLRVSDDEVYANLGVNILLPLFNENDPAHTVRISDRFISTISSLWSKNPQLVDIVCSAITPKSAATSKTVTSAEKIKPTLTSWRDSTDGTYRSLRQILDPLSVFAGRNPLVSLFHLCHIV